MRLKFIETEGNPKCKYCKKGKAHVKTKLPRKQCVKKNSFIKKHGMTSKNNEVEVGFLGIG